MNLIRKSIPNSGGIKNKSITDGCLNRGLELWNDKEITTTLNCVLTPVYVGLTSLPVLSLLDNAA